MGNQTIYRITNPNAAPLLVSNRLTGQDGRGTPVSYTFTVQVPPKATALIHLRDLPAIPTHFVGEANISANHPFTAVVAGYDPPDGTPTPPHR